MGDELGTKPGRTRRAQPAKPSNLRVVSNLDLDPATAEAKRRLLKPEPKPRSPREPMIISLIVTLAVVTMTVGYLGGRNNALFAIAPAAGGDATAAAAIAPETSPPETAPPNTSSPETAPEETASQETGTTVAPPPETSAPLAVVEPPELSDNFDAEFAATFATPERAQSPTTTSADAIESSVERSSQLAKSIATALEGRDTDIPVLSSGTVIDLPNSDLRSADLSSVDTAAEFIAVSTDIFGGGQPSVVQLDDTGDAFQIDGGIRFEYKSRTIDDQYLPFLDRLVSLMEQRPHLALAVLGHTDSRGDEAKNRKLSQERADSVVAYLMFRGIDANRLSALGEGASQPVASNDTEAGRELNRRIQLLLDRRTG